MSQDVVINGTTYPGVESISLQDSEGNTRMYFTNAVRYVPQTLTDEQKAQARENIGAASADEVSELSKEIADLETKSVKTVNGTAPDENGNVDVVANIEPPKIVSSVDEMTDTTKHYVLDGYIWHNKKVVIPGETTTTYPNQLVPSKATLNVRYSTNGNSTSKKNGYFFTDYIDTPNIATTNPYRVRLNWELAITTMTDCKFAFFDASGAQVGYSFIGKTTNCNIENGETVIDLRTIHTTSSKAPSDWAKVAKVKMQLTPKSSEVALTSADVAGLEITFDAVYEETTTESVTKEEWVNSGIPYAPTFKTDLIGVLGENNVIYLSDNLPSGTYTLKYPDNDYETLGTFTK